MVLFLLLLSCRHLLFIHSFDDRSFHFIPPLLLLYYWLLLLYMMWRDVDVDVHTKSSLSFSLSLSLLSLLAFILKLIRIIKIFFRYIYITKKCLDIYCSKSLNVYSFIRIEFISLYFLLYIILSFNVISLSFSFFRSM